jgi:hypothetical protein
MAIAETIAIYEYAPPVFGALCPDNFLEKPLQFHQAFLLLLKIIPPIVRPANTIADKMDIDNVESFHREP